MQVNEYKEAMEVYEAKKAHVHRASCMRMIIVLLETEAVLLPVTTFSTNVDILRIAFKYNILRDYCHI